VTTGHDIEPALDIRDLHKEFASAVAVDGVTMTIPRGEVFGLVGPDGAGKSTLIRLLTTVMVPTSGDALVFGNSVRTQSDAIKPRIGYMSQAFSLYGDLTVRENLNFFAELRGVSRADAAKRATKLLEFSTLTEFAGRQAQFLSGGMKQKLALAVTLISEPDLLFLDEPTTGVDPVSRREFWRIISDLNRQGITVFVATPYMDEAERCTEIAFMNHGRIILRDTPEGVKSRVRGDVLEIGVADYRAAMLVLRALPFVRSVDAAGEILRVLVDATDRKSEFEDRIRAALTDAGFPVTMMRDGVADLEMAFATLIPTGESAGSSAEELAAVTG
jgi:ABC-2 type transport system ATP-binding protein